MPTTVSSGTASARRSRTRQERPRDVRGSECVWLGIQTVMKAREIVMNVRRKWKSLKWLAAVVCGMAMTPASHGAVVYEYVSDQPTYQTTTPGSFINVLVYLKETLTGGSQSLITS